jgi:molybdate transport system substrate-binding protein
LTDAAPPDAAGGRDETAVAGISSMAVARWLAELCAGSKARVGLGVRVESVGGVDAARRVAAGDAFDFVVLAQASIDALARDGHVDPASRVTLARSSMAMAVAADRDVPAVDTPDAVRDAVLGAPRIAYSTGPSGQHLLELLTRWGIGERVATRLVQAPPGVSVASLIARGDAAIGFQQASELVGAPGIRIAGVLPAAIAATTAFSGAVCRVSRQPSRARAVLAYFVSDEAAATRPRYGLDA